ncbi:MAG: hypothetical protein ACRD8O_05365, partial [Bryobacteraceae bacterium]
VGRYWALLLDGGGITAEQIREQLGDLTRQDLQTMRDEVSRMTGVSASTIKQITDMIDAHLK